MMSLILHYIAAVFLLGLLCGLLEFLWHLPAAVYRALRPRRSR